MKAILMSIKHKWCELIASGKKTVEVRKTAPKDTPFKVYIYMTKTKPYWFRFVGNGEMEASNGKVIGEFICDKVDQIIEVTAGICFADKDFNILDCENELKKTCLSVEELANYLGEDKNGLCNNGYAWHISELKIYDEPKELSEFKKYNRTCYFSDLGHAIPNCKTCRVCNLTRPPQSWQYVESEEQE